MDELYSTVKIMTESWRADFRVYINTKTKKSRILDLFDVYAKNKEMSSKDCAHILYKKPNTNALFVDKISQHTCFFVYESHSSNRYPTPHVVRTYIGLSGSFSILLRRRLMCVFTVCSSPAKSSVQMRCSKSLRLNVTPGCEANR